MSSQDPTLRFIGVHSDRGPLALLGLSPDACSGPIVDAALVSRLARIYDHPDGRSPMGEEARSILRAAAQTLRDDESRQEAILGHVPPGDAGTAPPAADLEPSSRAPRDEDLSPLQHQLLQILASSGGWNAMARARLASIGAVHGIPVSRLIDELQALAARPRHGSPRPIQRAHRHDAASRRAMEPGFVERVVVQYAPELRSKDQRSLVKLCVLFGGIGVLLIALMYRLLFLSGQAAPQVADAPGADPDRPVATVIEPGRWPQADPGGRPLAPFTPAQLLPLTPLPNVVLDDVDAAPGAIRSLGSIARRVVGMEQVDPVLVEDWNAAIQTASASWFAGDDSTARALRRSLVGVFEVVGASPRLTGPLLASFAPQEPKLTADPLGLPRGAWRCGMASLVASQDAVSPAARLLAAEYMRNALGREAVPDGFDHGVAEWLLQCIPSMIDGLVIRNDSEAAWRLWYLSVAAIRDGQVRDRVLLAALRDLLGTDIDLSRSGLPQMVFGRLLLGLDWSDHASIQPVVLGWFDDPALGSTDVWVLASTMAAMQDTAWFARSFVPPMDADMPMRRRIKDRVQAAWPRPDRLTELADMGVPEGFDPQLAETWLTLLLKTREVDRDRGSVPMLKRLLMERLLAESAAALVIHGGEGVLASLNDLESVLDGLADGGGATAGGGSTGGIQGRSDGQWARLYSLRGRTRADKIDMFQELENQSGEDLGPIDADVLVREAMGASLAVREAAQYLIETRFSFAPNVAQAMVDRIPEAKKARDVSDLIESVTGVALPRSNSARWPIEARLALVNHALSLRLSSAGEIDALSEAIAQSMRRESGRMGRPSDPGSDPQQAARSLVSAWEDRIASRRGGDPWIWRDAWRDRRAARSVLAADALQHFLVEQIARHELLSHWTEQLQPAVSTAVEAMRDELSLRRDRAVHILEQMLLVESSVVDIWRLRIRHLLTVLAEQGFGGDS